MHNTHIKKLGHQRTTRVILSLFVGLATFLSISTHNVQPANAAGKEIIFPIAPEDAERVNWVDTWGAPRSGGRTHKGVDIFGPKMVKLVAVADSTILYGRFDNQATGLSGNYVKLQDDQGWEYLYVHLNNDTPGTDDAQASCLQAFSAKICDSLEGTRIPGGTTVEAGEFIGYLGDSGNAENTPPHVHFEVHKPNPELNDALAINPTGFVDASYIGAFGLVPSYPDEPYGLWPDSWHVSQSLYTTLYNRSATEAEINTITNEIDERGVWNVLGDRIEPNSSPAARITRLYKAFFNRPPDLNGLKYWVDEFQSGESLEAIAEYFALSEEFEIRYGDKDYEEFLTQLYLNVLQREPDETGKDYWLELLESGDVTRSSIVVYFSEGEEMKIRYSSTTQAVMAWSMFGNKTPTNSQIKMWNEYPSDNTAEKLKKFFG